MKVSPNSKLNPEKINWDYIIIGTGVGGSTIGYRLAQAGKKVLFCEQGRSHLKISDSLSGDYAEQFFPAAATPGFQHRDILEKSGRWASEIADISLQKTTRHIPFIGSGTGGSSALYGAAMERFWPEDFEPKQWHKEANGSSLAEKWPISYDELKPFYEQAESLYRVRKEVGSPDSPPQLSPANKKLFDFLAGKGMHPYRLPCACEFLPECKSCQGFLCNQECKNDSVKVCLKPAIDQYGATLLDQCQVKSLHSDGQRITGVSANWKGELLKLRGKHIILAAGALSTPVILLRSATSHSPNGLANESGMVGKNLMRHFVDMYVVLSGKKPDKSDNTKEIAFNDFYITNDNKFGSVQSFGWMPPAEIIAESLEQDIKNSFFPYGAFIFNRMKPVVRPMLEKILCNRLVLASTLEDLPFPENRVMPDGDNGIQFSYQISEYDKRRIDLFRQQLKQTFRKMRYILIKQAENNERLAHVCGTCRMGDNAKDSVVDKFNRAHDLDNLYIIDSSFFPSSGGTNPSLTIAANALRVASHLLRQDRHHATS